MILTITIFIASLLVIVDTIVAGFEEAKRINKENESNEDVNH